LQLVQPDSLDAAAAALGNGSVPLAGGTELVPLLRSRIVEAETLVDVRGVVPRGVQGTTIGAGTTLAELEADPEIPAALREACTLAASPQLRSMGTIGGNLLQATRCWYWRLRYPCFLHGGSECHARDGAHREHAVPQPEASTYLKAMERNRFSFPLVGVAAARAGDQTRLALAGVAPIPWLLDGPEQLDRATPLPGTAYKVDLARPLVRRALEALA
jgi:CO/xanthine dehydrogenase FAD-binding subunit